MAPVSVARSTPAAPVPEEEPLPLTLRFVFFLGGAIVVGWFLMFALLQARW